VVSRGTPSHTTPSIGAGDGRQVAPPRAVATPSACKPSAMACNVRPALRSLTIRLNDFLSTPLEGGQLSASGPRSGGRSPLGGVLLIDERPCSDATFAGRWASHGYAPPCRQSLVGFTRRRVHRWPTGHTGISSTVKPAKSCGSHPVGSPPISPVIRHNRGRHSLIWRSTCAAGPVRERRAGWCCGTTITVLMGDHPFAHTASDKNGHYRLVLPAGAYWVVIGCPTRQPPRRCCVGRSRPRADWYG